MQPFRTRLQSTRAIIADGAMGTMLQRWGLAPGDCPERMNLERADVLKEIAGQYLAAGAEMLQTNTFGGSPLKLAHYDLDGQTEEINTRAIDAVRDVIGDNAYLSASCGPSGRMLEPYGDASAELVFESFRRQMKAIVAAGVDMICIETMTDLVEAVLAVKALKSVSLLLPVCVTMTFDVTPRGFLTVMGTGVEKAIESLTQAGADIVGSNCGNGIVNMAQVAEQFASRTTLPVAIRSNAGIPILKDGVIAYPESPEFMAEHSRALLTLGVKIIGGCCGTTPEHVAALKKVRDDFFWQE